MVSVPILTYHEISARSYPSYQRFTVSPGEFGRQMAWLAQKGYASISLDELIACRDGHASLPARPVLLTFDDGCQECVDHATSILPRHGFTGMFYLVAGFMGRTTTWTRERRNIELPIIDWKTAQALAESGFSCGSHTMSHARLADLPLDRCREELYRSKAMLQDHLGKDIVHLSYPYGSFNEQVRMIAAEAGYRTAVTVERGLSRSSDDPLALHRITIAGDETFRDFTYRVRTSKGLHELLPKPLYSLAVRAKRLFRLGRIGLR